MGQYKVPQDVETEDKILGPLSIKQFIYIIIAILWAFLMWRIFSFSIIVAVVFALPVTGFFLLLGFGQREGVPFEDYVVAFIQFLIVPRKRIWVKDDSKEVIVADVKKPETAADARKNVSTGQLKQLASIIDTRGNFKDPSIQIAVDDTDASVYAERIIGPTTSGDPTSVGGQLTTVRDDVLDANGQRSTQVGQLLQTVEKDNRQNAVNQIQQALHQPAAQAPPVAAPVSAQPSPIATQIAAQGGQLTVEQIASRANAQAQQLSPGSSVQLRQPSI